MAELTADLFVTLDGFASGIDVGPYFGYSGPELDSWVRDHLDQPQLIVMGRVTYEAMAEISSSATDEVSTRMNELPKVVFSNTLQEPLAWGNTRLVRGDVAEQVRALKQQSADPLRSIGSITLVKSLLHLGLMAVALAVVQHFLVGPSTTTASPQRAISTSSSRRSSRVATNVPSGWQYPNAAKGPSSRSRLSQTSVLEMPTARPARRYDSPSSGTAATASRRTSNESGGVPPWPGGRDGSRWAKRAASQASTSAGSDERGQYDNGEQTSWQG
jgi:dihydrofolate reductase